ncbi:MAG: gliding motility protein GldN [Bacteroidales bacterium]|nr:gliding motility protein GldN [Bacteroidales bacterium]
MNIRISLTLIACFVFSTLTAQPPARVRQQATKATTQSVAKVTTTRQFPGQPRMPEEVSWRRDLYRTLDLTTDANAPLYYPTEPQGNSMSLFTYLFKLLLRGQVKAYAYNLNGVESFTAAHQVKLKDLMDAYHIYYETKDGRTRVLDTDLPSAEVTMYFVKEATYYDAGTAQFHTKVEALCPVLIRQDEFGGEPQRNPLFWVRYDDVAEYLARLPLMVSNINNASTMSAADYFALGRYEGKVYKTNNMQGQILGINTTDSVTLQKRATIEKQMADVRQHVFGSDTARTVTTLTDTTATPAKVVADKPTKTKQPRQRAQRDAATTKASKVSTKATATTSNTPRVTVRRQRR